MVLEVVLVVEVQQMGAGTGCAGWELAGTGAGGGIGCAGTGCAFVLVDAMRGEAVAMVPTQWHCQMLAMVHLAGQLVAMVHLAGTSSHCQLVVVGRQLAMLM